MCSDFEQVYGIRSGPTFAESFGGQEVEGGKDRIIVFDLVVVLVLVRPKPDPGLDCCY